MMTEPSLPSRDPGQPARPALWPRVLLLAVVVAAVVAFFVLGLDEHLKWETLRAQRNDLQAQVAANLLLAVVIYFLVYVVVTALSLPVGTIVTLAGGLMFGRVLGTVVVSFASTAGATLAFLLTRYLLRDLVQNRWGHKLGAINRGIEQDGWLYLLTLRLVVLFPFWLVNLLMGLTRMRVWTYWWVSQLGMLPATIIYVNAGTELGLIESPGDILSLRVMISLALLAIVPLGLKKGLQWWKGPKLPGQEAP